MDRQHPPSCCAKRHKAQRFLEACLLLLLYREAAHGYALLERLSSLGFPAEDCSVGALYKTLRKMEKEGLVVSRWQKGGPGPERRVYEITQSGRNALHGWIGVIKERKARIDALVFLYEQTVMPKTHNECTRQGVPRA